MPRERLNLTSGLIARPVVNKVPVVTKYKVRSGLVLVLVSLSSLFRHGCKSAGSCLVGSSLLPTDDVKEIFTAASTFTSLPTNFLKKQNHRVHNNFSPANRGNDLFFGRNSNA
eukprot:scpid5813/ scgid28797/ 